MSTRNTLGGPDEDEHYEVRELGHPNKSFRNMHGSSGSLHHAMDPHTAGIISEEQHRALLAAGATIGQSNLSQTFSSTAVVPQQQQAALASSASVNNATTVAEQIRASKNQAIEILQAINAESVLERPISEFIRDVEASYDENDPEVRFPKLRAAWTREEDQLLMVGVRVYGPNTESWPRIAMLVPGRTNKSCRKRWFHSLDPSLHKGPWTAEEDDLLRQRVAQYPSQWSRVAEGIPGRTDDQCAKRWRESLDPEIDRSKWRPEEDRLLLEKYAELGTQWQKIATFFQGRPGLHCRNRWRKIYRVISQKDKKKKGRIGSKDIAKDLALVTESVNRRKTAQRSRPQGKSATDKADMDNPPLLQFSSLDTSPKPSGGSTSAAMDTAHQPPYPLNKSQSHSREHMYSMQSFGLSPSLMGTGNAGTSLGEDNFSYMHRTGTSSMQRASSHVSSPEIMGALYMPTEQHPASAAHNPEAPGGVKRTSSVMYSPTDEQRQRLQKLKLKLYGCAAASDTCEAVFADALSLNSHLKMVHPNIAAQIPSLNIQGTIQTAMPMAGDFLSTSGMDTNESMALASAVGGFGKEVVKPYRCAMPGCGNTYKNVNGLEYHIFQSRKAKSHLMPETAPASNTTGCKTETMAAPAATSRTSADVARDSTSPSFDFQRKDIEGQGDSMAGSQAVPPDPQILLQCTEVDCLAKFCSEHELRQHIMINHPRPIRRATKPSHKAKSRQSVAYGGSNTPLESGSNVFWGTASSSSIGDMLGVTSGVDAAGSASSMTMPVIHESSTPAKTNAEAATAAAIAAAMGYRPDRSVGSSMARATPLFSPLQQPAASGHHQLHHSQMAMNNMANQQARGFVPGPSAPFMSAPALISETGGEPNVNSYFMLDPNRHQQQQQQQQNINAFAPFLLNSFSAANSHGRGGSAMAVPAPPAFPTMGSAQRAIGNSGNLAPHGATPPRLGHSESVSAIPMGQQSGAMHHETAEGSLDNFRRELELMQTVLSPFYPPGGGPNESQDMADGDVQMGQQQPRSHRSDSVDLASLATVPITTAATSQQTTSAELVESPVLAPASLVKSGAYSQMASAMMSRLGREKAAAAAVAAATASAANSHAQPGPQNLAPSQWSQQDLSALGLLSAGNSASNRNSFHEAMAGNQQRMYTPQPADLAQFQQSPATSQMSHGQMLSVYDQHPPATSLVPCPVYGCTQSFSDANTLKHHLHFDHPREEAGHYSIPGSPMVEGVLSTLPAVSNQQQPGLASGVNNSILHSSASVSAGSGDRAKAPHWVDPNAWSTWIAAANGHGNITAAAAATAMGITPGISGVPQSFISASQQQQMPSTSMFGSQDMASENELLRMFESITKDTPVNQSSL
ncbi:hypothetical protein LPJ78_000234 [Coemansia sp. RSA 989]|nr:hypothetical protein LPJ78_000234 [Coemansia sp. RSA 989]